MTTQTATITAPNTKVFYEGIYTVALLDTANKTIAVTSRLLSAKDAKAIDGSVAGPYHYSLKLHSRSL